MTTLNEGEIHCFDVFLKSTETTGYTRTPNKNTLIFNPPLKELPKTCWAFKNNLNGESYGAVFPPISIQEESFEKILNGGNVISNIDDDKKANLYIVGSKSCIEAVMLLVV